MRLLLNSDDPGNSGGASRSLSRLLFLAVLLITLAFPLTSIAGSRTRGPGAGGGHGVSGGGPLCLRAGDFVETSQGAGDIPKNCPSTRRFSFAAVGDQDYDTNATFQRILGYRWRFLRDPSDYNQAWLDIIGDINAKNTPFTIHVGDILLPFPIIDPSEIDPFPTVDVCNGADLANRRARMEQLNAVVLTPGDNEWIECFQDPMLQIGGWPFDTSTTGPAPPPSEEVDPLELLDTLIAEFYPDPDRTLGRFPIAVERQPNYPENVRFLYGKVMYVTMHIVGGIVHDQSNPDVLRQLVQVDGCPIYVYSPGATPNPIFLNSDGTGRTDLSFFGIPLTYPDEADGGTPINPLLKQNGALDCTEQEARQAANIDWLRDTYRRTMDKGARAIVISFQADLRLLEDGVNVVDDARREFFQPYVDALREAALSFPIPTLHIHGDYHTFTIDKPYKVTEDGDTIENVTDTTRRAIREGVDKVFRFSVCNSTTGACTLQE
jgi:hypothetical protein